MGWRLSGSTVDAEVDTTFQALRVTIRPFQVIGWQSLGAKTGSITSIAANSPIFSLRQIATTLLVIRRMSIGFLTTSAFSLGQIMDFSLNVARGFTASDSGGTTISFSGNNSKHRTSLTTLSSTDCRISTTAALTNGTKTLDTTALAIAGGFSSGLGSTIQVNNDNLFSSNTGDYPLVLSQNEGINISNITLMGALGIGVAYVNIELAEANSY